MKLDYAPDIAALDRLISDTNPITAGALHQERSMMRNAMRAERDGRSVSAFYNRAAQRRWIAENRNRLMEGL